MVEDWRRRYNQIGLLELLGIAAVVVVAVLAGHPELMPGGVCLVVALHFVPLAEVFGVPRFLRAAAGLGLVSVVGMALSWVDRETGLAVVGLGAALTLWWASLPPVGRRSR